MQTITTSDEKPLKNPSKTMRNRYVMERNRRDLYLRIKKRIIDRGLRYCVISDGQHIDAVKCDHVINEFNILYPDGDDHFPGINDMFDDVILLEEPNE